MAVTKLTGRGSIATGDYKFIKYVGITKGGKAVTITLPKAICRSNPDWTFADKDDTVATIEFEGVYNDADLMTGNRAEPWTAELADGLTEGTAEILLGVGKFYIGTSSADATCVGLTRGGGSFTVDREIREINADGDPGAVENRLVQDTGRPKLKFNALQFITKIKDLYAGIIPAT